MLTTKIDQKSNLLSWNRLGLSLIVFNKIIRLFPSHTVHMRNLVSKLYSVEFTGMRQQFRSESGCYELGPIREFVDHIRHSLPVLGIQSLIDFIEQVEGGRITLLDDKDKRHGHERFLSPTQLVHFSHLVVSARERN